MTTTKTSDVLKTVLEIKKLEKAGAELIRVAVLDLDDAKALGEIKSNMKVPLVADIHFDYKLALEALNQGIDKLRLNPGNIKNPKHIKLIVDKAKERKIPIRIGVNSGSLPNNLAPTANNLVKVAKDEVEILESLGFYDIIISLKSTDIATTIKAYELASQIFPYPLHVGLTEAGNLLRGTVKSVIALEHILNQGIGNTIRISLTDDPVEEIKVAKYLLQALHLKEDIPELISCPTCGRLEYNMLPLVKKIDEYIESIKKPIKVAIMGCIVNGPGEAKEADIGLAGGKDFVVLFKKGKIIKKVSSQDAYLELKKLIDDF
jgi:(E)-4-hydroxy-3-methylbut-2-enyl-diphosphate synthase